MNNELKISGMILGAIAFSLILIPLFADTTIFLTTENGGTPTSCAPANGLVLAQNLTDLCDVTIISPLTNQIIEYNGSQWVNVNSTPSSPESTVCSNIGLGIIIIKNSIGGNCTVKSLLNGTGITISNGTNDITISSNVTGESTVCTNQGTGKHVFISGNCDFRTFKAGSGLSIANGTDDITYTNTAPESTVCTNAGSSSSLSEGICINSAVTLKRLLEGTGILLSSNSTHITITNSLPEVTACNNVGTGNQLCSGGNVNIDTLIAGTGITITDTTDDWTFASQCANTGTGEAICESSNNINSLIAGNGITITDTTGDLTVARTRTYAVQAYVFQSVTKTNLPTVYTDIYTTAFDSENMVTNIDCTGVNNFAISYMWDFVGAGTDQVRWVEAGNNSNVLKEDTAISADQDSRTGIFARPAWCTSSFVIIEMQAKSSNGTNDPVAKGYVIWAD